MADELKSCPFCGSDGRIEEVDGYRPSSPKTYRPACANDCGIYMMEFDTKIEAVAAWNKRAKIKEEGSNDGS